MWPLGILSYFGKDRAGRRGGKGQITGRHSVRGTCRRSTRSIKGMPFPLPIAGGAYWRLLPFKIIDKAVRYNIKNGSDKYGSPICYVHPWEIDPQQPYFPKLSANNRIRHYVGIKNFAAKINRILENFHSTSINDAYLRNVNLTGTFPESNISSFSAAE